MTVCFSSSLCRSAYQLKFVMTPPKSLHPTYAYSSSFPSRHPPSLVPGHQVSNSRHLFLCRSTISVSVLPWSIGPVPPTGCSSISLSQKLCTHPHSWQRPLSWGFIAANSGEDKVDREPRPLSKH